MKSKISAREAAARACVTKKHTKKTLYKKLLQKGYDAADARQAVIKMAELSYIDEAAFARAYVADAYKIKKYGALRIRQYLKESGVPERLIDKAIDDAGVDEKKIIAAEIAKRFSDEDDKNKILRYFLRRGFCIDNIRECLDD